MHPKLKQILLGSHFIGIEMFTSNKEEGISIIGIERKKNELDIFYKEKRQSFDQINYKINNEYSIILVINNSNIIQKEVESTDPNDAKILNKAFPNIKNDEFYYEIWRFGTKSIIAICRKDYVNELLVLFKKRGVDFSCVSLGVCSLSQITSFTDISVLQTNSTIVSIENNESIIKQNENLGIKTIDINGLEIQSSYLLGFASLLGLITKNSKNTGNINALSNQLFEKFIQNSFFKKGIKLSAFSLLFLLLINFFIFNHYYEAVTMSNSELESKKDIIENIKSVKQRLKSKEEKLKSNTILNSSKTSWHINEILNEMPSSILLDELVYNPLEKTIKDEEKIITKNNTVIISGKTNNNAAFTSWVDKIEANKSVYKVIITSFRKNENKETVFSITITITSDET